jgi:hypothetical protein
MLILSDDNAIDREYKFEDFKRSILFDNQQDNRFFWLENLCHIKELEGFFKVGLWFKDGSIRQIQLLYMDNEISDEIIRKKSINKLFRIKYQMSNYRLLK